MTFGLLISGVLWCLFAAVAFGPRLPFVAAAIVLAFVALVWQGYVDWRDARRIRVVDPDACYCAVGLLSDQAHHPLAHGLDCPIRRRYGREIERLRHGSPVG